MAKQEITPKYDSTLGLIFRLNALWAQADLPAQNGEYGAWNNVLDRLYNNLAYRSKTKVTKNSKGEIVGIVVDDEDDREYNFLSKRINFYKRKSTSVKGLTNGISNKKIMRSKWYDALNTKDIWLRRFMHKLNLYIKETTKVPGSAMWGGK